MEDWIATAINSAKDQIQKDAAVANDTLSCNRWIASSFAVLAVTKRRNRHLYVRIIWVHVGSL